MIESRLLVAKPFAFLLNQSRSRLLYFSRSGEATAYTTAPLPRLASVWQSFYFACFSRAFLREGLKSFSLGPKASVKAKDLIQRKSRILSAADMRLRLGDHIMP